MYGGIRHRPPVVPNVRTPNRNLSTSNGITFVQSFLTFRMIQEAQGRTNDPSNKMY